MILFKIRRITSSFTRPSDTTAYASGDLVANSTTAGSVTPLKFNIGTGGFRLHGIRIGKSGTTITNATFTLHLFESIPTVANGDNGAISTTRSSKVGSVDLPIMVAYTDAAQAHIRLGDTGFLTPLAGYTTTGLVYGLLEAKAAYTPASAEVFDVILVLEQA